MNAPVYKTNMRRFAVLAAAATCIAISGCAGLFDPATDPTSAAAARVDALVAENRDYPQWADFPTARPTPPPSAIAAQVVALKIAGSSLANETARIDWTPQQDPSTFASETLSRIDPIQSAPVSALTGDEIEAFAREMRDRAKAPPPIDRRIDTPSAPR